MARKRAVKVAALAALLTAAAAWLWAHEGHAPLPTRGVTVDADRGQIFLSPETLEALQIQTAEVRRGPLDEHVLAPVTVAAPWQRHAFATSRLGGKVIRVHVKPGQPVAAGQPLADVESLELEDLQLELLDAHNKAGLAAK